MKAWYCHSPRSVALLLLVVATAVGSIVSCRAVYTGTGGSGDFLTTGRTQSHFRAIQVDPASEDSAGPQFVVAEDLDGDGLLDLVSAWNQSQPVQVHLQRRDASGAISFETITLAGSVPVVNVAGLAVADFDLDDQPDIAVLVKETLLEAPQCLDAELPEEGLAGHILVYFGPTDPTQINQALAWEEVPVGAAFLQGSGDANSGPENGGYTSLSVGDMDGNGTMDMVVAWNSSCGPDGSADVLLFSNGGPLAARDGNWSASKIPNSVPIGTVVKSVGLGDIDQDGDLDIVATFPDAQTMNIRWFRNPAVDIPDDFHLSGGGWQVGAVAQIATGADVIKLADIDQDGILDVVVRSSEGGVIQWLKGPPGPTTAPVRAIPWQVYTLAEFTERTPEGIAVGDLNSDGQVEIVAAAEGGLLWFDSQGAATVFDQWRESFIVDERPDSAGDTTAVSPDPADASGAVEEATAMNSILVTDLDADGVNDLVVTFDRSGLSGLSNDALIWFRNTRP